MSVLTLRKRIIYDTHGANIYINICTTKIFIEKVKMTINYQEEIKFISNKIRELKEGKTNDCTRTRIPLRHGKIQYEPHRIRTHQPYGKDHVYHMQCTERQSS